MNRFQIVLDTNVIYASLRSKRGASYRLLSLLGSGKFDIHLTVPLVFEYEDVLKRNQETLIFSETKINQFLDYICKAGFWHEVYFLWRPILNDPADDMILEVAVGSQCQYIVTYNKQDFQGVERFGIELVTAKEFLKIIEELP